MENKRIRNMTEGSPIRHLIGFALPLMVGNMFQQFYAVVDTAVVGQVNGVSALASLGAADWINWMMIGILQGFTQGFSILMAQNFGAGDYKELRRTVGTSYTLCGILAAVMLLVGQLCINPILGLMNTPADIMGGAALYLRVVYGGLPIIMAYNLLASILRALGDSKTPLYAMIVAALINVGLDCLFVIVFHWGIAGAAAATVIAQAFSSIYCFRAVRKITFLKLSKEDFIPRAALTKNLFKLASPIALQNGIISVGGMVVQTMINGYGMLFIAGFTATNKMYGLLEIAAVSYGYAVTSYVGQNLGARLLQRIKQGVHSAALVALVTSAVIALCMIVFGKLLLALFISGTPEQIEEAMGVAYSYLVVMSVCLPILYMLHIYRSALMGLGDTVLPMASGFVEMLMRIASVVVFPLLLGREGLYYAEVCAWVGATILLIISYYIRVYRLSTGRSRLPGGEPKEIAHGTEN